MAPTPPPTLSSSLRPLPPEPLTGTGGAWELPTEGQTDPVQDRQKGAPSDQLQAGKMTGPQWEGPLWCHPSLGLYMKGASASQVGCSSARSSMITLTLGLPYPP